MPASIRGHMGQFQMIENGRVVETFEVTNVQINQDSNFQKTFYVGNPIPEGDQSIEGFSGSCDFEVKNASLERFIDALITNNLNGIGVSDYAFVVTENYPDGTSSTYAYNDVQWRYSRNQSGLNEKITKRLDFQAMSRVPIE